jgi:hypothetical protein
LCQRRRRAIEHGVSARHFNPFCVSFRKESCPGFDKSRVAVRLGSFEAAREGQVGKREGLFASRYHGSLQHFC